MRLDITKREMKAALVAAAKGDIRHYLNGVLIEPGEDGHPIVVSTNGHILTAFKVSVAAEGEFSPVIVPRAIIDTAVKSKQVSGLRIDGATITIELDDYEISAKALDGAFPDWRCVVPAETTGQPGRYSATYLKMAQDFAGLIGDGSMGCLHYNGATSAAVLTVRHNAIAVIMPISADDAEYNLPDFAARQKMRAAA